MPELSTIYDYMRTHATLLGERSMRSCPAIFPWVRIGSCPWGPDWLLLAVRVASTLISHRVGYHGANKIIGYAASGILTIAMTKSATSCGLDSLRVVADL